MALILSGDTGVPASGMPAGSVIQTVQGTTTTYTSTTSTSYVVTNITASITPTSASSKILVLVSSAVTQTAQSKVMYITVYRNGTNIGGGSGAALSYYQCEAPNYTWVPMAINYVDSPASTSALTYTVYIKTTTGGTAYIAPGDITNTIILQEIHG